MSVQKIEFKLNEDNRILSLLFPPLCGVCQKSGSWLCRDCLNSLCFCESMQPSKLLTYPGLRSIWSACEYHEEVQILLQRYKFQQYRAYSSLIAKILFCCCEHLLRKQKISVLVPVPIHQKRLRERGFNQTELIARELGKLCHIPVNTQTLIRSEYREHQSHLGKKERSLIKNPYKIIDTQLVGQEICLIDDVVTTGATLSACAKVLENGQAQSIFALTFAQTP